jgi:uncharacterized protein (DUF1778 family)
LQKKSFKVYASTMAKRTGKTASTKAEDPENLTTFSIRLNDQQRQLVEKAASLRGWTPTNLVRVATIERAAHIVNISGLKQTDFKGFAADLAKWMFTPRSIDQALNGADLARLNYEAQDDESGAAFLPVHIDPRPISDVHQLKRAAQLGGAEFMSLMVEFAESVTASHRTDLEKAIDPADLLSKSK